MLFSESNKREPYRPAKYRPKTALENDSNQEEGLFGDEFEGDISNDPLEDLVDHAWAVDPNEDQVVNFEDEPIVDFEEEYEREDPITNTASRTSYKGFPYNNLQEQPFLPGHKWPTYLYRGLTVKMPSDMEGELNLAIIDGDQREIYRIGKKILDTISSKGMGRHWTTEPDIAMDFAQRSAPNGNLAVVLSVVWERDGEDLATEHEGYDGVVRPSRLVGEEEVTLERGTRIKVISMKASRVGGGTLYERNFELDLLDTPQTKTASEELKEDDLLDTLNPTGSIFVDYDPDSRASKDLAPNIVPYSETAGISPDERFKVYRGVPKGVQSELADGDFITDMKQLAQDYAGTGDVITQYVFADEVLDDTDNPMAGEYLFRPRKASKKTAQDYFMEHRPAGPDFGSPLHDLNDMFPDIYESPHYYDFGEPGNKDSLTSIQRAKGNPEEMVTMYRSIPSDGNPSFAPGDWVSTSGDYARQHSLSDNEEDDDFIVMEQQVPASALWSEGNSVAEWGYHGDALDGAISEKYTPKKTLERLRSQKSSSRRVANERVYYHNTTDPDFSPDSSYEPYKAYFGAPEGPGIYLTDNTSDWTKINNGMGTVIPTHRAEFSTSAPLEEFPGVKHSPGGISQSQFWVPGEVMSELNYRGVFPIGEATKESSRREANEGKPPGNLYRGIGTDSLTREEYDQIVNWAQENQYDPENFTLAEPNYEMIYPILERLEEEQGLGRHWSTDYDVAKSFAGDSAWENEDLYWDEENKPPLGIVFRGDWGGDGEDFAEFHRGYDGIKRPSRLDGEEEVTLHPGSEVNLLGIDVFEPGGDVYDIPVPDIPVYSRKKTTNRKKTSMDENQIMDIADQFEREIPSRGSGGESAKNSLLSALHDVASNMADAHLASLRGNNRSAWHGFALESLEALEGKGLSGVNVPPGIQGAAITVKDNIRSGRFEESWPILFEMGASIVRVPEHQLKRGGKTSSLNKYLRFANRRGLDPKDSRTSRSFRRASRGLSPRAMTEISSWMKAQKTAGNSARRVLANTRSYRHKMASDSWYLDNKLSAYVSKTPQKFACSCGSHIAVPSYTNCKCGKVWNAYSVKSASQGDMMFVVREVPVRENVIVASKDVGGGIRSTHGRLARNTRSSSLRNNPRR